MNNSCLYCPDSGNWLSGTASCLYNTQLPAICKLSPKTAGTLLTHLMNLASGNGVVCIICWLEV